MNAWYFAYGSNLWIEQVVARTGPIRPDAERPRIVRLPNHRLVFNMCSPRPGDPDAVYANIEPRPGEVLGVVYSFDAVALQKMDVFEAGYVRQQVAVQVLESGEWLDAVAYIAEPDNTIHGRSPDDAYLQRIVRGAKQHALPDAYILQILKAASIDDTGRPNVSRDECHGQGQ